LNQIHAACGQSNELKRVSRLEQLHVGRILPSRREYSYLGCYGHILRHRSMVYMSTEWICLAQPQCSDFLCAVWSFTATHDPRSSKHRRHVLVCVRFGGGCHGRRVYYKFIRLLPIKGVVQLNMAKAYHSMGDKHILYVLPKS